MSRIRVWALVAVVAMALGAFEPFYIRIFFTDRSRLTATLTELPYRRLPRLRAFLLDVRQRTPKGGAVAIADTFPSWSAGYEYCYGRATYLLAGRLVLALRDRFDRPLPANLARAEWIAAYRSEPRLAGFVTVWRSADGSLLRRIR